MGIIIKTEEQIALIRESCRRLSIVHKELEEFVRPGISTKDIDIRGDELIRKLGGIPNFLHYNGYPASICVSVNDEVVHGIPNKHRILQEGEYRKPGCGNDLQGISLRCGKNSRSRTDKQRGTAVD